MAGLEFYRPSLMGGDVMVGFADDGNAAATAVGLLAVYLLLMLGIALGCGFGARALMRNKGRSPAAGFCLGFFLGVVGLIIAAVLPETPEAEAIRLRRQMELMGMAPPPGMSSAPGAYVPTVAAAPAGAMPAAAKSATPVTMVVAIGSLVLNVVYVLLEYGINQFSYAFAGDPRALGLLMMLAAIGAGVAALVTKAPLWVGVSAGASLRIVGAMFSPVPALVMALLGVAAVGLVVWLVLQAKPEMQVEQQLRTGILVAGGVAALIGLWGAKPYEAVAWLSMLAVYGGGFGAAAYGIAHPSRTSLGVAMGWSSMSILPAYALFGSGYYGGGAEFAAQLTLLLVIAVLVGAIVQFRRLPAEEASVPTAVVMVPFGASATAPATAVAVAPVAGQWAADPFARHQYRYHDGQRWTDQVSDNGVAGIDQPVHTPLPPQPPVAAPPMPIVQPVPVAAPSVVAPLVDNDATVRRAPNGSVVTLQFSNGSTHQLVGVLVLGRKPVPPAQYPHATLLELDDPSASMSRSHCLVGVDGGDVWVEDLGSANGTVVANLGREDVLGAGQRLVLTGDAQVEVGDVWFRVSR